MQYENRFILQYARPGLAGFRFWKVEVNNSTANGKPPLLYSIPYALKKREVTNVDFHDFRKDER